MHLFRVNRSPKITPPEAFRQSDGEQMARGLYRSERQRNNVTAARLPDAGLIALWFRVYGFGMDEKRELLRHTLATLAYRAARALEGAPEHFAGFDGAGRVPVQILSHMGDLFDWALSMAVGQEHWHTTQSRSWAEEQQRFFSSLRAFDSFLASEGPLRAPVERLFQGPVADALTHVGQLAMLRRLSGSPIRGENFFLASIAAGQVGADQPAPVKTF
jgi:hypothetical protein